VAAQAEGLAGQRDHVGLRDRLPERKRDGCVVVGGLAERLGDEELAGHALHRGEHALVADPPPGELALDPGPGGHAQAASATAPPKCSGSTPLMPVIDAGGGLKPTVSIGTSESAARSDPWLPPPAWWRPPRSANS